MGANVHLGPVPADVIAGLERDAERADGGVVRIDQAAERDAWME